MTAVQARRDSPQYLIVGEHRRVQRDHTLSKHAAIENPNWRSEFISLKEFVESSDYINQGLWRIFDGASAHFPIESWISSSPGPLIHAIDRRVGHLLSRFTTGSSQSNCSNRIPIANDLLPFKAMRRTLLVIMLVGLAALSGCCAGLMGKQSCGMVGPTDFQKNRCSCLAEDAAFHVPCGPSQQFYGLRPTCWHEWPASGAEWRDLRCGSFVPQPPGDAPAIMEELPEGEHMPELSPRENNPFHDDSSTDARRFVPPTSRAPTMTVSRPFYSSEVAAPPETATRKELPISVPTRHPIGPPVTTRAYQAYPAAQANYVEKSQETRDAETLDALGRLMSDDADLTVAH